MIESIQYTTEEEWAKVRRSSIGASEAAGVLGCSPWDCPFTIWAGKVEGYRKEESEAMRWGKYLEDVVARIYGESVGQEMHGDGKTIYRRSDYAHMHATPDRWRKDGRLVEIKTASEGEHWGKPGTDEIPEHYMAQCQHQMFVLSEDIMDVAVLVAGNDFRTYTVERRQDAIRDLVNLEWDFWKDFVQPRIAPPIDYSHPASLQVLSKFTGFDESAAIEFSSEQDELIQAYALSRGAEKFHERRKNEIKGKLLTALGNAGFARGLDGRSVKRKIVKRRGYEVQPTEYVSLTVKEALEKIISDMD